MRLQSYIEKRMKNDSIKEDEFVSVGILHQCIIYYLRMELILSGSISCTLGVLFIFDWTQDTAYYMKDNVTYNTNIN